MKAFPKRYVPTRLICIRDSHNPYLCLADELSPGVQYATLSHCWGSAVQFILTKANFKTLRKRIPMKDLSKTFQHACFLARRFGFDYLWIDSLCIMQDDAYDWQIESSTMASVYACSTLNIAASYARDGTVGCFVKRNPEDVVPCQVSIGDQGYEQQFVCVPADFYRRGLLGTSLGKRAWAFKNASWLLGPSTSASFRSFGVVSKWKLVRAFRAACHRLSVWISIFDPTTVEMLIIPQCMIS